jgi:hypothetical protein
MIFLHGAILSFKIIFSISWIGFSILLTFFLSMLSKEHKKGKKEKISPYEN